MRFAAMLFIATMTATPSLADFDALLSYARMQDVAGVRAELEAGANPNPPEYHHSYAPLQFAAGNGDAEITRLLLAAGAATEYRDHNGDRALLWAAQNGHASTVMLLLAAGSSPDSDDDPCGNTPLMEAARYGHAAVVKLLLEAGADTGRRGQVGDTGLHVAAIGSSPETVQLLLEAGANPNVIEEVFLETPLHVAARWRNVETIRLLAGASAALEARTKEGATALFIAAQIGHADNVAALLAAGANPDAVDFDGRTPILAAIASATDQPGRDAAVNALAEVTADLDRAFAAALGDGFIPAALRLIERGASPNAVDIDGRSVLANSTRLPGLTFFQLLLNKGADLDRFGAETLLAAAEQGHTLIAGALLERGIAVDERDPRGATPLLLAAKNAHVATVELLLAAGAERVPADSFGLDAEGYMSIVPDFLEAVIDRRQASRAHRPTLDIEIDLDRIRARHAEIRALLAAE